ncbi:MAG TPA: hypothetical protein PKH07_18870, partial [bacterium]|nr:hypothetical protein [bacterium]
MPKPFPSITPKTSAKANEDRNPGIQLLGRRFFSDQTVPELLLEMLLVATSAKRIGDRNLPSDTLLPERDVLLGWPEGAVLEYAPKARLNLKMFAFLSASKLETRHESHRQHYRNLIQMMGDSSKMSVSGGVESGEVIKTLENLFLGFQSVGGQRTWCAASFLPVARALVAAESIWRQTRSLTSAVKEWSDALPLFSQTQHLFLARGGELLYLQLCNALRQDAEVLKKWSRDADLSLSEREGDPVQLNLALGKSLASALDACPETVGKLAEFIDAGIESETSRHTDFEGSQKKPRFAECGWCPEESWQEGALFAVELMRLCESVIDPIERLEMLQIACAMQLLRSLCAQSVRYTEHSKCSVPGCPL